jgi:periplasmic protein TonB
MALNKNPKAELRGKYKKFFEVSLVFSLLLLIAAFKYFPEVKAHSEFSEGIPEIIKLENIEQTRHEKKPPPPKPAVLIESSMPDEDLTELILENVGLDFNNNLDAPPPLPDKKITEKDPSDFFITAEEMPEPIGGIAAIQSKIVYPEIARKVGIEGKVYVLAFVDETGVVAKAQIIKGIGAGLDEAALNAVLTTKFKPGIQRGKPVRVQISIPIVFRLN